VGSLVSLGVVIVLHIILTADYISNLTQDPYTSHRVFSKASVQRYLNNERLPFSREEDSFPGLIEVQLRHLSMVEFLSTDPSADINAPLPSMSTTRQALGNMIGARSSSGRVEHELQSLIGTWAGYYGYGYVQGGI
jgi:hypothetical protein